MAFTPTDPTKAEVRIIGTAPDQQLDFYIPRGAKGEPGGFNAGTVLGTVDLNQIVTPGLYKQDNSTNVTALRNYPKDSVSGSLKVYDRVAPGAFASVFQEWTPAVGSTWGAPTLFIRYSYNGNASWSPWRAFNSTRVDQTAGRVIYQWDDLNSREQLIYGDTGQRSVYSDQTWVDALTGTGLTLAGSQIARVRRVGNVVELVWAFDKTATGSITCTAGFPLGFRPAALWNAIGITSSMGLTRVYHAGGANPAIYQSGNTTQLNVTTSLTYTTGDAWPTTLPGTAVGGVPNL